MFAVAGLIGIGQTENFGPTQPIGTALGVLSVAGGLAVLWLASDKQMKIETAGCGPARRRQKDRV